MSDDTPFVRTGADHWFSSDEDSASGPAGWRLDVVTLLAVIGESSIAEHAQTITASALCLLPRIIPAPQALLKGSRPSRMPETAAKVTGIYSGVSLESVGFFANIIHPLDEFKSFGFKMLEISHKDQNEAGDIHVPQASAAAGGGSKVSRFLSTKSIELQSLKRDLRSAPPSSETDSIANGVQRRTGVSFQNADVEAQAPKLGITRRATVKDRVTDAIANPTFARSSTRPAIPAALYSPIHILSVFSMILTIAIIIYAGIYANDGTAMIAVSLISVASSIVGAASWWRPMLMKRSHTNTVPDGDVAIRTREGAFLIIKCTENVARELYAGTEECVYRIGNRWYTALMGLGTFLLMISVILLGNCKWQSQVFISASYIALNGMYWAMGLLPRRYFWDLSRYEVKDITPDDSANADEITDENDFLEGHRSFTRTLWYCIRETKRIAWVERSGAAPSTPQWKAWLAEAEAAALEDNRKWPAVAKKDALMKMSDDDITALNKQRAKKNMNENRTMEPDPAGQVAPAVEVLSHDSGRAVGAF